MIAPAATPVLVPAAVEANEAPRVRLVCVSDTHDLHQTMPHPIPPGDIFVHAGDFTCRGARHEVSNFVDWTDSLLSSGFQAVVFVMGNHELGLDRSKPSKHPVVRAAQEEMRASLADRENVFFLEESSCTVLGLTFFGSPYTCQFGDPGSWEFQEKDIDDGLGRRWQSIPPAGAFDVLLTHSPPFGVGDLCDKGKSRGSQTLQRRLESVRPRLHVFGHMHAGHGIYRDQDPAGHGTVSVNAAICDEDMAAVNAPVVVDMLPGAQYRPIQPTATSSSGAGAATQVPVDLL